MDPTLSLQLETPGFPSSLDTYGLPGPSAVVQTRTALDHAEEQERLDGTGTQGSATLAEPPLQLYPSAHRPALQHPGSHYGLHGQAVDVTSRAPSESMHMAALALEDIAFGRMENTHREIGLARAEEGRGLDHGDVNGGELQGK